MKIIKLLTTVFAVIFSVNVQAAMDHSRHNGGGSQAAMGGSDCLRPHISKMQPVHLTTVVPGSEFSFVVTNLEDPKQVSVEVKRQPVEVEAEFKDPFYIVKGKIPSSLHNTVARVDVKIDSKFSTCRAADGWLLKISEN